MAFRNLRRRRLRTALTVSGIVVGIALMFVLLTLVAGMDVQVRQMVRAMGGADITIYNGTRGGMGEPWAMRSWGTLNESLTASIQEFPGVFAVSPQLTINGLINGTWSTINGISPASYSTVTGGLNVVEGNALQEDSTSVIVLGKTLAANLNATLGEFVAINTTASNGLNFKIIGIFETGMSFIDQTAYIPLEDAQNLTNQQGLVSSILVKCTDPNLVSDVANLISSQIEGLRVVTQTVMVQQASQMLNTMTFFFTSIGAVALTAGSVGVVNTMVMSVVERTREIGTLKAIGARNSTILRIFLTEALQIGLLGGVMGVISGIGASYALPIAMGGFFRGIPGQGRVSTPIITPAITPINIALCFMLGTIVGTLSGLYPALRAARMKPVEALRHV